MQTVLEREANASPGTSAVFWRQPIAWLREKNLSRGFWIFFTAAFFFDFGFSVYYFLFNLYLLDLHFNERAIGLVGGALALGSVAGTLPAGMIARRIGVRPLLIVCFIAAPVLGAARSLFTQEPAQIGLAFFGGLAMCLWGVCFLPAVARLTSAENRASAFSLIFSVSIGTSALGGIVCGYLPQWLHRAGFNLQPAEVKRLILLSSCGIAAAGLSAILRLRLPQPVQEDDEAVSAATKKKRWQVHPFLLRFLPAMALWTAVLASFTPFANVYLSRQLHVPMLRIGQIFSVAMLVQLAAGLCTPLLFRALGLVRGVVVTQLLTGVALGCLAATQNARLAIVLYLGFSAMQWMSSPGLYHLLMDGVPDAERSTAAAMTMFCNAVVSSCATAGSGALLVRFGYPHVLAGIAVLTVVVAVLFRSLAGRAGPLAPQP